MSKYVRKDSLTRGGKIGYSPKKINGAHLADSVTEYIDIVSGTKVRATNDVAKRAEAEVLQSQINTALTDGVEIEVVPGFTGIAPRS